MPILNNFGGFVNFFNEQFHNLLLIDVKLHMIKANKCRLLFTSYKLF